MATPEQQTSVLLEDQEEETPESQEQEEETISFQAPQPPAVQDRGAALAGEDIDPAAYLGYDARSAIRDRSPVVQQQIDISRAKRRAGPARAQQRGTEFYAPLRQTVGTTPVPLDRPWSTREEQERESPDVYLDSNDPPEGWQPSPIEVNRLVTEGLLSPEEAGDVNTVWRAGRASARNQGGASWFGQKTIEGEVARELSPESAIQKAMVSQIPLNSREIRGDIVLDTHKMFRQTREYWKTQFTEDLLREGRSPSDLSPEEAEELNKLIDQRALNSMGVFMNSGGRMFYTDAFDRDITKDIADAAFGTKFIRAIAAPTTYGRIGAQVPGSGYGAQASRLNPVVNPVTMSSEGLLSRFGRFAPSTFFTPKIFGGHEIGSEEWVEAIRAGDEITEHIGDIARRIDGVEPGGETSTFAKTVAGVGVLSLIVLEPDIVTLLTLPASGPVKAAKLAQAGRRTRRAANRLRELQQEFDDGLSMAKAQRALDDYDRALMLAVNTPAITRFQQMSATRRASGSGMKGYDDMYETAGAAREEAERLRKELDEFAESATTAEQKAMVELQEARVAEHELWAAYTERELVEGEKNLFLEALGLSPEDAAKIRTERGVPIDERAARQLERAASLAKKQEKAIRNSKEYNKLLSDYDKKANELGEIFNTLQEGFLGIEEAQRKGGGLRVGWEVLSTKGNRLSRAVTETSEPFSIPIYGQKVRLPTPAGGSVIRTVEGIRIRGPKSGRLSKGNDNQIVLQVKGKSGEIEEYVHPYRLPENAARNIRSKIKEFEEMHKVVAAEGGLMEQIVELRRIQDLGKERAAHLRLGGAADRVKRFQRAEEKLAEASKKYKEATKAAGVSQKDFDKLSRKFAKKGEEVFKAEQKASQRALMREIYAKSIDDVASGLENLHKAGLENLGVVGFKTPKQIAKSMKAIADSDWNALRSFGTKLDEGQVARAYRNLMKSATKLIPGRRGEQATLQVDADKLMKGLASELGGPKNLAEITKASPPLRKLLERVKTEGSDISLDLREASALQEEIQSLIRTGQAQRLFTDDVAWGRAVNEAWRDIGIEKKSSKSLIRRFAGGTLRSMSNGFQEASGMIPGFNIEDRIGLVGDQLEEAFKQTELLLAEGKQELLQWAKADGFGETAEEKLLGILDFQGDLQLPTGPSRWSVASGMGTPYQKGKLGILADTRIDPVEQARLARAEASRSKEIQDLEDGLVARIESLKAEGKLKEGLTEEFLDEMKDAVARLTDEMAKEGFKPVSAITGAPISLVSVSRMWVPRGEVTAVAKEAGPLLMGLAKKYLDESPGFGPTKNTLGEVIDVGFAEKMRKATYAIIGNTEYDVARAYAFASSGLVTSATLSTLKNRMAKSFGTFSPEEAADINRLLAGESFEDVGDIDKAIQNLNRLGMPFTQKDFQAARGVPIVSSAKEARSKRLVEIGAGSYAPENLIRSLDVLAGRIAKEFDPFPRQVTGKNAALGMVDDYLRLWKGSAVTGLLAPNPRYWTNNMFGDFVQMWQEVGIARAGSLSFVNGMTNIPFFGRGLQEKTLFMAERVAGKSGKGVALPGMVDTFLNPHLARIYKGEKGEFITKNGDVITFDQARRYALEDGINDTFVREELLDTFSRAAAQGEKSMPNFFKEWQGLIYNHASMVQDRQRMGLYLDSLQRGMSRQEAKKTVDRALYDWKHGISETEAMIMTRFVPFWRFYRLSMKQMGSTLLEPFVRNNSELARKALTGDSRLARLRQNLLIFPNLPNFFYQDGTYEGMSMNEKVDAVARELYPSWADTRPKFGVIPFDPVRRQRYKEITGKDYTHAMILAPQHTGMDMFDMTTALFTGVGMMLGKLPGTSSFGAGFNAPSDVGARFFEPILGAASPPLEMSMRALLSTMNADLDYQVRGSFRSISPEEETVWRTIPGLSSQLREDPETGRSQVPIATYMAWRMLPIGSTQATAWIGATTSPEWEQGFRKGFIAATKRLTGFMRESPFNIQDEVDGRMRDIRREFTEFIKSAPPTFEPYSGGRIEGLGETLQRKVEQRGMRSILDK